ncbi:MAG: hypothetical protein AAGI27_16880 [Pseudomonadota bacterium]
MEIVYAAEAPSIADLLAEHIDTPVHPSEIRVSQNPDETGSYLINHRLGEYRMSPSGRIFRDTLRLLR